MLRTFALLGTAVAMLATLRGQETVCDVFKDLKANDGRQVIVTGELIVARNFAAIGAGDCDYRYTSDHQLWPVGLRLRSSDKAASDQIARLRDAGEHADRLRKSGKTVTASATFIGRVNLGGGEGFPADLSFDSFENLKIETLPNASELPVVSICDLFKDLPKWKGQRIAVRGEVVGTMEGSWFLGRCLGDFYTNGYRWPVSLSYGSPAYESGEVANLIPVKQPAAPPKGFEEFRGRYSVVTSATYVGRLRMRDHYMAACREGGDWLTNGFGHLNGAVAEIVVEEIRDVELTKAPETEVPRIDSRCDPLNVATLCPSATLPRSAALGCNTRLAELLSRDGIDGEDGYESAALSAAIRAGNVSSVDILLKAGAPVNPQRFSLWPPLGEAARWNQLEIMKILIKAGAKVDTPDKNGNTYLASYGFFDNRVLKILLEAGANPNAIEEDGQTALMQASRYGYEEAVILLIDHGALVNQKDNEGRTALMYAANGEFVDAIPHLLSQGADVDARDRNGKTALDLARASRNDLAVNLILAAMQGRR